jgi:Tfp pilus assembly protein PilW
MITLTKRQNPGGMTIIELLLTIIAGSIVILGVYRLLGSSMWSYNLQNQMTDMYQNATYAIGKLNESLAQVGANLPEQYYTVVLVNSGSDVTVRTNKTNAKFVVVNSATFTTKIPVAPDSIGKAFVGADSMVVDTEGWYRSAKIDSVKTGLSVDTVVVHVAIPTLNAGNIVYASSTVHYFVSNGNFCIDSAANVQAENIDSMCITFRDTSYNATTNWNNMAFASLYVRARTASPDPKYKCPGFGDGYHRLALTMDLRLRNRF